MVNTNQRRLTHSMSPYLRQHADNPVDWWEWSDEAFAEAKRRNLPVLVSIGYATCHWCHVMAHESFEDPETAALMNTHFINIKVDREERPDVDSVYMDAVQALHGRGGWPLHAFIDHEGRPFFAGMYFPRERWQNIVAHLGRAWHEDRAQVDQSAHELTAHLATMGTNRPSATTEGLGPLLERFDTELARRLDPLHPGLGGAPKFPPSQVLSFELHRPATGVHTFQVLEAMQDSGLHDRVGGGFHRYSTDRVWRVPHFEKMLYDQAQLLECYALAAAKTGRQDFWDTAEDLADYLVRDLAVRNGDRFLGFASAEDADDPGGEGSFYAWPPSALAEALAPTADPDIIHALVTAWDLAPGEREIGPSGHLEPVTHHIPHPRAVDLEALAQSYGLDVQGLRRSWRVHLPRLREVRDTRPRPIRDDKVLTDLNGLTLVGLSALARFRPRHRSTLRLLADAMVERIGPTRVERLPGRPGYITDYGHLALGLLAAFEVLGDTNLLDSARRVIDLAIALFAHEDGGFYSTPIDGEALVRRSREDTDGAYPSGQHALALALVRLSHLTHDSSLDTHIAGVFAVQRGLLEKAPTACATLLDAMFEASLEPMTVVIGGQGAGVDELADAARSVARAGLHVVEARRFTADDVARLPLLEGRLGLDNARAFVCVGHTCLLPVDSVPALLTAIGAS